MYSCHGCLLRKHFNRADGLNGDGLTVQSFASEQILFKFLFVFVCEFIRQGAYI